MKIFLANLASPANPGDFAILQGSLKLIRSLWRDAEITVSTRAYSERHAYEALRCRVVPSYPNVEGLSTDSLIMKLIGIPKALAFQESFAEEIRQSDLVFLSGGAYFYSNNPILPGFTFLSHLSAISWAKLYKKKIVFLPQSFGPFQSFAAQKMFDDAIQHADLVFYREQISGDWLSKRYPSLSSRFSFMPDLALNITREDLISSQKLVDNEKVLGVTVRPWKWKGQNAAHALSVYSEGLKRIARSHDLNIKIIVHVQDRKKGEGDEAISESLKEMLWSKGMDKAKVVMHKPYFTLSRIAELYSECELVVGMRLHSVLTAFLVGSLGAAIGYQHKAQGVLEQLNLSNLYLGSYADLDAKIFEARVSKILEERSQYQIKIKNALDQARETIHSVFHEKMTRLV
jgi:colanic acid/amylovoran biosynthesis protein